MIMIFRDEHRQRPGDEADQLLLQVQPLGGARVGLALLEPQAGGVPKAPAAGRLHLHAPPGRGAAEGPRRRWHLSAGEKGRPGSPWALSAPRNGIEIHGPRSSMYIQRKDL